MYVHMYIYTHTHMCIPIFKPAERDHGAPTFVHNLHAISSDTSCKIKCCLKTCADALPEVTEQCLKGSAGFQKSLEQAKLQ